MDSIEVIRPKSDTRDDMEGEDVIEVTEPLNSRNEFEGNKEYVSEEGIVFNDIKHTNQTKVSNTIFI